MNRKLKYVIVDNDPSATTMVEYLCEGSSFAEITHSFNSSRKFLKVMADLDFDGCFLDISMPEIDGILVARKLKDKLVIYVTGKHEHIADAIDSEHVDILLKPIKKARFERALEKAYLLKSHKEGSNQHPSGDPNSSKYALVNIAESREKVRICLADIYFVANDSIDSRNKLVIMKDGKQFTLMRRTFEDIIKSSPGLVQINRSELISFEAVQKVRHDLVTIKFHDLTGSARQLTLNRTYRKTFMEGIRAI